MADLIATPRITSSHLDNFTSRTIRIIGKVLQLRGDSAILDSDGNVTLLVSREHHLTVGQTVEIVGRVNLDLSVRVHNVFNIGKEVAVNMNAVYAVVDATHRYKEIFYE